MKPEPEPFDPMRWAFGDAPAWSLIEILVRGILIYMLLLVSMRLMGKRVAGQMSISELAVVVTLGAAVGVPLQVQDRGMLPPVVILLVAIAFQRGLSLWAFRSRRIELVTQGEVAVLLRDGVMDVPALKAHVLSRERLFSMLRTQGVEHLGQLHRVYLEANGQLSLLKRKIPEPGLCILPPIDNALIDERTTHEACRSCGSTRLKRQQSGACLRCGVDAWTEAMKIPSAER